MNRKSLVLFALSAMAIAAGTSTALAHCQIPCGIYDDPARFTMLKEHVTTIEKSMNQIQELSAAETPTYNQIVRWVVNKDSHADQLSEIVTYYFMAQRIKPADPTDRAAQVKYLREITLLHQMLVYAMKAKQTTDLENCAKLRELISKFEASYLGQQQAQTDEHSHDHAHSHDQAEPHTHAVGAQ